MPLTDLFHDHFRHIAPIDWPIGHKLEAPPLHLVIAAIAFAGFGVAHTWAMQQLPRTQTVLALVHRGFHPKPIGRTVPTREKGSSMFDDPSSGLLFDAARRAYLAMSKTRRAAGARSVTPVHERAVSCISRARARTAVSTLPPRLHDTRVLRAHVIGGCATAGRPELGVVRADGAHWQANCLSVHDGSLFPTSLSATPQVSVYGLPALLAKQLAHAQTGCAVRLG